MSLSYDYEFLNDSEVLIINFYKRARFDLHLEFI